MAELLFPWEKAAAKQEPMPNDLDLCQQQAFQAVSTLYGRYKARLIDKDSATEEKRKIKLEMLKEQEEMEKQKRRYSIDCKYENLHRDWVELTKSLVEAYRKAATDAERLDAAARLVEALDGVPVERSGA